VVRYVLTRLAWSLVLIALSTVLVFAVLRVLPSDPVLARLGASTAVDPATLEQLRHDAGLHQPIVVQYFRWVGGLFSGDLGRSYTSQLPVSDLLAERLPVTLELTVLAMLVTVLIAVPLALLSAYAPGSIVDGVIRAGTAAGMSMPAFIVAIILVQVLSVRLRWFPSRGSVPFAEDPLKNLQLFVLPTLTLALVASPLLIRHMRESMLEAYAMLYVRTAEGKGAGRFRVLCHHVLRNSLVPSLTMLGLLVGYTLAGTVVIEYVFGLPGIGSLAIESAFKRDYAVLQVVVLVIVTMFIATSFVVDLLYGSIDPRLKVARGRG
jgi:peptide/nickel transport system permease protein